LSEKQLGFTLIELLVVISIIGILASLALVSYSGAQKQARDSERRSDLNQYRNGLEQYATSNSSLYPVQVSEYVTTGFCGGGDLTEFLSSCPDDPTDGNDYYYLSNSQGLAYLLYGDLETGGWWFVCSSGKVDKTADETKPGLGDC